MTITYSARVLTGAVRCDCCALPVLRVVGQTVVIEARHHGERHVSVLEIRALVDKATEMGIGLRVDG